MQFKFIIALVALCALTNGSRAETLQHHLAKLLSKAALQSRAVDPICFVIYSTDISDHTQTYEDDLDKCAVTSSDETSALDDSLAEQRNGLETQAESGCQGFDVCNQNIGAFDFFSCYATNANAASKTAYTMNIQATQNVKDVKLALSNIEFRKNACDSTCKMTYETALEGSYNNLQLCINGPAPLETKAKAVETKAPHSKVMKQALRKH